MVVILKSTKLIQIECNKEINFYILLWDQLLQYCSVFNAHMKLPSSHFYMEIF